MSDLQSRLSELGLQPVSANGYCPATADELDRLVAETGGKIPEDYLWFLSRYGYSLFENAVSYPAKLSGNLYPFAVFYGSDDSGHGVLANYFAYRLQTSRRFMPIGGDGLGNLFGIIIGGPTHGNVCYWNHDAAAPEDGRLEPLTGSFTDFVLNLEIDE